MMPTEHKKNYPAFGHDASNLQTIDDEIVISGFSGRFPESSNIEEFKNNLLNGIDMVNDDPRRWPNDLPGVPPRAGKIKEDDLANFDHIFFGVHSKQAEALDPVIRMLLEATHEAIIDAGYNPRDLRGSRTGVYTGLSGSDQEQFLNIYPHLVNEYGLLGSLHTMFANRLSYTFDLRGPSMVMDTACSSSLHAMNQAFFDMRTGRCDAAIVTGGNLTLRPGVTKQFADYRMLNPEGYARVFDESANGYVRADACGVLFLQKAKDARRIYSTILNIRTNADGAKEQGITYPSGQMQQCLIEETFKEINLNPLEVVYVEAHGTGTTVGDPEEVNAICEVFCNNRKTPLPIGSVKSNMGHSEPASGVCSVAKILIAMEEGILPGNLHYSKPNPKIPALIDGRIEVLVESTPWNGGIVSVNNFGFGGSNAHVILKSNPKVKISRKDELPRLVVVSGRTSEAVNTLLTDIETHAQDEEYLALINEVHSKNIPLHNYRGYAVVNKDESLSDVVEMLDANRPIWFVYTGMGSQWAHMAKDLMQIDVFRKSLDQCAAALRPEGIDLIEVLINMNESHFDILYNFIAITAMQIALTDLLQHLEIIPDGFVGHSVGELGCAYADGGLTLEQTILASYWRGRCIVDTDLISGMMASVGLSWDECLKRLPEDIFPACHNSADNVTISGPTDSVNKFVELLNEEGIFVKSVNVAGRAFHSKYIADAGPLLKKSLDKIIPDPKDRTERWISSSILEADWNSTLCKKSSADYHVNNLLSPVYFHGAIQHVPKNAICIEIAPHGLLQAILRRSLGKDVTNVSLMKRDNHGKNFQFILNNIGKLYAAGAQPVVNKLFPHVTFPVARGTPMLNSKIKWDHSQKYNVPFAKAYLDEALTSYGVTHVEFNLSKDDGVFLKGHNIDGRILFPATGYLMLAWRHFSFIRRRTHNNTPVVFENVSFHRANILLPGGAVKLTINFFDGSEKFEICEGNSLVASGTIRIPENIEEEMLPLEPHSESINDLVLNTNEVYKELRLRGYDYSGLFRGIVQANLDADAGKLRWNEENWVTFMDTMLQFGSIQLEFRDLFLPKRFEKVIINPEMHLKLAEQYRTGLNTDLNTSQSKGSNTDLSTDSNTGLRSDESEESIFPVYLYRDLNVLKSGGIEIRGVSASLAPRRQNSHAPPVLERYTFIPNFNIWNLPEDSSDQQDVAKERAKEYAITSAVQLAIENCKGAFKIKTTEVLLDMMPDEMGNINPEKLLSSSVKNIIENEPILGSDTTIVVTESTPELQQLMTDAEIHIVVKDIKEGSIKVGCHIFIATDILKNLNAEMILKNLRESIGEDCFILLDESTEEGSNNCNSALFDKLNCVLVSSQAYENREFLLLRPIFENNSHNVQVINVTEKNFNWLEDLKNALRTAEDEKKLVYVVCQGEELFGAVGLMNCLKYEVGGKFARLFFIQDTNAPTFSLTNPFYAKQITKNLIMNVLKNGSWGTYRYLKLNNQDQTHLVEHAFVNNLIRGNLSSFKWIEGSLNYNRPHSDSDEVCSVYYATLNFRDIMLSIGKLDVIQMGNDECILGIEFSGRDSKGNRIMALAQAKSFATMCVTRKILILPVPDTWTLEEASTVPVAYGTAYYGLVIRGKMKKGETILIHAGAGGVGQAAIAVALNYGLTVFTTVGSKEKREFLMKAFPQLNDCHIGNSRDCSFEQMIMRETKGKGVDLVLNSLADDKFRASVRCLGQNGRFIEIGKFDLTNNTPLGTSVFLKNTSFHGVLVDDVLSWDDETVKMMVQLMSDGIKSGAVRPLPLTLFDEHHVEEAFRFMASGKHIGKVVIKIREEEEQKQLLPSPKLISAIPRTYMYSEKTYVVVGGLGGFGLELIHWLIARGAKNIVASSRSGIKTGYQSLMIRRWKKNGINIVVDKNDVATQEGVEELLKESAKLGAVGGIFNLAVVLHDAALDDQTQANFEEVCLPKINATKFLDAASRTLCPNLDYFICFSSVVCGRGNIGQVNYGLANSGMERICEARQAAGYHATVIQWGAIGDTGILFDRMGDNKIIVGGTVPQRISSCLETIDILMQQRHSVLSSMVVMNKCRSHASGQLSVSACVANILGIRNLDKIPNGMSLIDLGMDSLMGVEIKQTLERNYDLVLNVQEIKQLTFGKLKEYEVNASSGSYVIRAKSEIDIQDEFTKELMPKELLVRLPSNAVEDCQDRPIFVIHSIEGFVGALKPLAAELNCPVWGLQCTEDVPLESIQDMTKFYICQMKTIQSTGPYNIVGYSYGAVIACEMAQQLEMVHNDAVNVILLDGSPTFFNMQLHQKRSLFRSSHTDDENIALWHLTMMVVGFDKGLSIMKEVEGISTKEKRNEKLADLIHKTTKHDHELIRNAATSFGKRVKACAGYKATGKIKTDIVLIKASSQDFNFPQDYGLKGICDGDVKIHVVNGNHRTIIIGESVEEIAEIIRNFLRKSEKTNE